jgi:phospholipid/cholesterol/gamma-HCH transport system substrate-binding protein
MKFQIRFADQIVGLFIILALLSVIFILVMMGINQRWFAKDYNYTSSFKSGNGLSVGMPIKLKGFQIGSVDKIDLLEDNTVEINFHIFDTYIDKVRKNSVIELSVSPIGIGSGGMLFHPGKSTELIPELSFIPSTDFKEGNALIVKGLVNKPERDDTIVNIINDISPLLRSTNSTMKSLDTLLDTTNATFNGESEGPLTDILNEVALMVTMLNKTISNAMLVVNDILSNTYGISSNLEITTAGLTETKGLITHLLDPKGSIATLLNDDNQLYKELFSIVEEASKTTEELTAFINYINSTQPQISELLESSREAIIKGKDVLEGLSNNPLLRGGITSVTDQPTTFKSYEEEEF